MVDALFAGRKNSCFTQLLRNQQQRRLILKAKGKKQSSHTPAVLSADATQPLCESLYVRAWSLCRLSKATHWPTGHRNRLDGQGMQESPLRSGILALGCPRPTSPRLGSRPGLQKALKSARAEQSGAASSFMRKSRASQEPQKATCSASQLLRPHEALAWKPQPPQAKLANLVVHRA